MVWSVADVTAEREVAKAAREELGRLADFFDHAPVGLFSVDLEGRFRLVNEVLARWLEQDPDRMVADGVLIDDFIRPADSTKVLPKSWAEQWEGDDLIVYIVDTTEQKKLELQFAQSQKMQAVGQLAGGIAHDFNNLLTAMISYSDLLLLHHQPGDQDFADIMQIKQNANRAANLVRQLLAFSRRQTLNATVLNLTDVLAELVNLVRRLIGEHIELAMIHGRDLGPVMVDQGQLEQVIINMAVNARDAMPDGGKLTIQTMNRVLDTEVRLPGFDVVPPGDYVAIELTDSGVGITGENLAKIFEPFYTTKKVGEGTVAWGFLPSTASSNRPAASSSLSPGWGRARPSEFTSPVTLRQRRSLPRQGPPMPRPGPRAISQARAWCCWWRTKPRSGGLLPGLWRTRAIRCSRRARRKKPLTYLATTKGPSTW